MKANLAEVSMKGKLNAAYALLGANLKRGEQISALLTISDANSRLVDAISRLIAIPEVARIAKGTDAMRVARELLRELGEDV